MPYLNANSLNTETVEEYDVCIIGSGAAGIAVAKEFISSKQTVIMLEAGGIDFEEELQTDYTYEALNGREGEWQFTRTRQWGGTTSVWYGRCTPLKPIDLEDRPWVNASGWPISFEELEKYNKRAFDTLKVSNQHAIQPSYWHESKTAEAFDSTAIEPRVFLWSDPKDMAIAHHKEIEASNNVTLCYYAFAQEITPSENNDHAETVIVRSSEGNLLTIKAKAIVLAGGAIENSRLLLLSQKNCEHGLGNQHDNVGRYYMDHPRLDGKAKLHVNFKNKNWRSMVQHLDETITPEGNMQLLLTLSEEIQRKENLLNHGTVFRSIYKEQISPAYLASKRLFYSAKQKNFKEISSKDSLQVISHLPQLVSTGVKNMLGRPLTFSHLILMDQLEQEPDRESRIMLNGKKDRFGQAKTAIKWEIGESTTRSLFRFHQELDNHLRKTELGWLESPVLDDPETDPGYTDACHPSGTTRMSVHPKDGVVDPDCRVHGIDNLYITGSSVFPTVGYANPTLTLVALAIRVADKIKAKF